MDEITAIVPFYNEQIYLKKSVSRLLQENLFKNIVLVNDCSEDKSLQIAEELALKYENIILVSTSKNLGKGNAVKIGLNNVTTKYVIVHDADLEYFPSDIKEMLALSLKNKNSVVIGSRVIGNKKRINVYKRTFIVQKIFSKLFSILNSKKISDLASCYWLIETETLKKFDIQESGFAIEVEVISKAIKYSLDIFEVPINYHGRTYEDGKKIKLKDGILILIKIFKYSYFFNNFIKKI